MTAAQGPLVSWVAAAMLVAAGGCGGGGSGKDADAREDAPADPAADDGAGEEIDVPLDREEAPEAAEETVEAADPPAEEADGADEAADDAPGEETGPCDGRTGGALVTLTVCGDETMTEWIESDAFIDEAIAILGGAPPRVPNMPLAAGEDCDPQWSWHVDPRSVAWADMTIELCDGCPSMVEADLDYWLTTVRSFCPWNATVSAVDDRR